jgi:S1/P1 Nuclease
MRKFTAILLCGCVCAFGWGGEGHSLVARIAWDELTPAVRAKVTEILGPGVTIQSVASWADNVRNQRKDTGPWHYIDIPIDKPHLDMARDCPNGDCVIAKIEDFRKQLKDPAVTGVQRREALMFLIHFVGDMHQPLHCSDNKDKGGNDTHIVFNNRPSNLHSLWDSGLLGLMGKEDDLLPAYSADAARHAKSWRKGSVSDWAEESHREAVKITYGKLPKAAAGTQPTIGEKYEKKAEPEVKEQIEKAGVRLARVLNEALQ